MANWRVWMSPLAAAGLLVIVGCASEGEREGDAELPVAETGVRLSEKQIKRLGLELAPVVVKPVAQSLQLVGWLEARPGSEVVIRSPVAGVIGSGSQIKLPHLGQAIQAGMQMTSVRVFLSPQDVAQLIANKEDNDVALEQSLVSMKLADEQLQKAATAQDVITGTRLNDLREIYARAQVAYREAREKLPYLAKEPFDEKALLRPVVIDAPINGTIVDIRVADGQFVTAGDPLWSVADWSRLWLRVPVFETDYPRVVPNATAIARAPMGGPAIEGKPISAPQPTQPRLRTVDLLFEIENHAAAHRPGQSLRVDVPIGESREQTVIPHSALLWDAQGQAWIYIRREESQFERVHVELGPLAGKEIVVTRGLKVGQEVVSVGAASLYGEEFKGLIPRDNDD